MTATPSTTSTDDQADAGTTAAAQPGTTTAGTLVKAPEAPDAHAEAEDENEDETGGEPGDGTVPTASASASTGIGAGAAAVVSAALGLVSLTGTWTGKVLSERETLLGQIKTAQGGSASAQIHEIYGDSWHTTAAVNGGFALLALLVGAFVLARPAFGAPEARPRPVWVRAVALGGLVLGAIGLLLSVGMYFDLFATLPSTGS